MASYSTRIDVTSMAEGNKRSTATMIAVNAEGHFGLYYTGSGREDRYFTAMKFNVPQLSGYSIDRAVLHCVRRYEIRMNAYAHLVNHSNATAKNFSAKQNAYFTAISTDLLATSSGYIGGEARYVNHSSSTSTFLDLFSAKWDSIDVTAMMQSSRGMNDTVIVMYPDMDKFSSSYTAEYKALIAGPTFGMTSGATAGEYQPYIVIEYSDIAPNTPTIISPSGDVLEKTNQLEFKWSYSDSYGGSQSKYEFGYRLQGSGAEWTTTEVTTSACSRIEDVTAWSTGVIEWRVKTYNQNGAASGYATATFELLGNPDPHTLGTISNDAIPEITWNVDASQVSKMEFNIYQEGDLIWASGERTVFNSDAFKPNCILANGDYTASVRVGNIYDLWSEWTGTAFTLNPTVPTQQTISLKIHGDYIEIITNDANIIPTSEDGYYNEYFLYRSTDGINYEPIGRNISGTFIDATVQPNVTYTYFVRRHFGSYIDSNKLSGIIKFNGYRLSSVDEPTKSVLLNRNLSRPYGEIKRAIANTIVYNAVSGQEYKMRESGITQDEELSGSYYIDREQFEQLQEILNVNGACLIRSEKQVMYCDVRLNGITNAFHNKGYDVTIVCTKIDYDDKVHFDW